MTEDYDDPAAFYDAYGADEWERLTERIDGQLERDETLDALDDVLPDSGHVLDAGGGAGRYAIRLADRGYDVTLLDLSAGQLAVAREQVEAFGVGDRVTLTQGSVTDLGVEDDTFDATCSLGGPLSHVLDAEARERAVRELRRVTAPGGPVVVSVMGRLGVVQFHLLTGHNLAALPDLLDHGDYDAALLADHGYDDPFTATHYFRREELVDLLETNGLDVERVKGLEGLASPFHDAALRDRLDGITETEREAVRHIAAKTADDPAVADLSIHMLAVGRA